MLGKWNAARNRARRDRYQLGFVRGLIECLLQNRIYIFALTSSEAEIAGGEVEMIAALQAHQKYRFTEPDRHGESTVTIGPMRFKEAPTRPVSEKMPRRQAIMLLWMAYGLQQMIAGVEEKMIAAGLGAVPSWELQTDRLACARDQVLRMNAFRYLLPSGGSARPVVMKCTEEQFPPDNVADNLAGLFNDFGRGFLTPAVALIEEWLIENPGMFGYIDWRHWGDKMKPPEGFRRLQEKVDGRYPKAGEGPKALTQTPVHE
jgi:hypothetical protein